LSTSRSLSRFSRISLSTFFLFLILVLCVLVIILVFYSLIPFALSFLFLLFLCRCFLNLLYQIFLLLCFYLDIFQFFSKPDLLAFYGISINCMNFAFFEHLAKTVLMFEHDEAEILLSSIFARFMDHPDLLNFSILSEIFLELTFNHVLWNCVQK
jgi:hypothetical protein